MHDATAHLLRFFEYGHLSERLSSVSARFRLLALQLVEEDGLQGPELTVALRKLLEAKDAAVRAALPEPEPVHDRADEAAVSSAGALPSLTCNRCKGSGIVPDYTIAGATQTCPACKGVGGF